MVVVVNDAGVGTVYCRAPVRVPNDDIAGPLPGRSSQVGARHTLYLYSAMGNMSLRTSSSGRRATALTSQESWTACGGGWF
jgi:hypothetical protein